MLALLLLLSLSPASAAPRVDLLELCNYGLLHDHDGQDVEVEATYAGPLQRVAIPVPARLAQGYVTVGLFPARWSQHPMRGTGLVEPLTAFIPRDDAAWAFTERPGAQVVVRGRFEVVSGPSRDGSAAPQDSPLLVVQEVLSVDALRRLEASGPAVSPSPGAESPDSVLRRRARLIARRGDLAHASPKDLTPEERIRRRELLIAVRGRLDASAVVDESLRRRALGQALEEAAFPPLQEGEAL